MSLFQNHDEFSPYCTPESRAVGSLNSATLTEGKMSLGSGCSHDSEAGLKHERHKKA